MAENKKSFILYADLINTVSKLPDHKAGKLFKTILQYVNDQNPQVDDLLLQVAFEPIKQQLKRDLKDWERAKERKAEAGRLGGIKSGETRRKQNEAKGSSASKNEANEAVNVTATVNDTVTEEGGVDEATEKKIKDFTTNQKWKEEFCIAKNISPGALEKYQQEFLTEKSLTGESIYSYKRYFLFWYNKTIENGTHKQPVRKSGKPGKSDGANNLINLVKQDFNRSG